MKSRLETWWTEELSERDRDEIALAFLYATCFHHGTSGHHDYMLLAGMIETFGKEARDLVLKHLEVKLQNI